MIDEVLHAHPAFDDLDRLQTRHDRLVAWRGIELDATAVVDQAGVLQ
jgi:hypothetical protein